jgi:hypothetical protein
LRRFCFAAGLSRRTTVRTLVRLCVLFAVLWGTLGGSSALAASVRNTLSNYEGTYFRPCTSSPPTGFSVDFLVDGTAPRIAPAFAGGFVTIDGTTAQYLVRLGQCDTRSVGLPEFAWSAIGPFGETVKMTNASTLKPSLPMDVLGPYTVTLTACPRDCRVDGVTLGGESQSLVVTATATSARPPEEYPLVPVRPPTPRFRDGNPCESLTKAGLLTLQWLLVHPILTPYTPADYTTVEGTVLSSDISHRDFFTNHSDSPYGGHSQHDAEFKLQPDPQYEAALNGDPGLLFGQQAMDVEWEWNAQNVPNPYNTSGLPVQYLPTPRDRVSVFGFLVHDCSDDHQLSEIHPPVGLAVQRPRPVDIPPASALGSTDVVVPGIVTDVFFNPDENTPVLSCKGMPAPAGNSYTNPSACGPLFRNPVSIDRTFSFNINLPKSPQEAMNEAGFSPPATPLYYEDLGHAPGITITPIGCTTLDDPATCVAGRTTGVVTYLHVTVNPTALAGNTQFHTRIVAAWVLPSPTNWRLNGWNISFTRMNVSNLSDSTGRGDWNYWINVNNTDQEWTQLMQCDGCVANGPLTVANLRNTAVPAPWRTGGFLGPNVRLFPGDRIVARGMGYELDSGWDDGVPQVGGALPQQQAAYSFSASADGGASYTADVTTSPVSLPPPQLSGHALRFYESYLVSSATHPRFPTAVRPIPAWPQDGVLDPRQSVPWRSTDAFEDHPCEPGACFVDSELQRALVRAATDPSQQGRLTDLLASIHKAIILGLRVGMTSDTVDFEGRILPILHTALPPSLYATYFAHFRLISPDRIGLTPSSVSRVKSRESLGGRIIWTNDSTSPIRVVDLTGLGLTSSPSLSTNDDWAAPALLAGAYEFGIGSTKVSGTYRVPTEISPATGTTATRFLITLAVSDDALPAHDVLDVQVRPPSASSWSDLAVGVHRSTLAFTPTSGAGTYAFRARVRDTASRAASGYSPAVAISVTAG